MRLLLDECVPARLSKSLLDHQVVTVVKAGWSGVKNGQLLVLAAAAEFDAFITVDKNLPHQQNMAVLPLTVIVLDTVSNELRLLVPLMPELERILATCPRGCFRKILGADLRPA
jgi:predicted nuclease of predicted toxin-antitoxin system